MEKLAYALGAQEALQDLGLDKAAKSKKKAKCPGSKIRSKGKGRGLGIGKGEGPLGLWRR